MTTILAWALAVLAGALAVASFVLEITGPPAAADSGSFIGLQSLFAAVFAATGLVIALRRKANPIGWIFAVEGLLWALSGAISQVARRGYDSDALGEWAGLVAAQESASWAWIVVVLPVIALVPQFFPNGRLLSRRWIPLPLATAIAGTAMAVGIAISPNQLGPLGLAGFATLFVCLLLTVVSLGLRLRRGDVVERQQLKVFLYAVAVWPVALIANVVTGWSVFQTVGLLGIPGVPIAIAIAILRYRLYDIDLLIRRTIIYGGSSAVLVGLYVMAVAALQFALSPFTSGSGLAVAVSTLLVIALFEPLRHRIQDAVDRRFYRRRYDAARALDAFAERLRDEIDLDALRGEVLGIVGQTVQPAHASLWLRGSR